MKTIDKMFEFLLSYGYPVTRETYVELQVEGRTKLNVLEQHQMKLNTQYPGYGYENGYLIITNKKETKWLK